MSKQVLVGSFLFLLLSSSLLAEDTEMERNTLKGLKRMRVVVKLPDFISDQFSTAALNIQVELKLRMVGINVLPVEEWKNAAGWPCLEMVVDGMKNKDSNGYFFNLELMLVQEVVLSRNNSIILLAPTWSTGKMLRASSDVMLQFLKTKIDELLDEFANAYLSVNPK